MVVCALSAGVLFLFTKLVIFNLMMQGYSESKISRLEVRSILFSHLDKATQQIDLHYLNPIRSLFMYEQGFCYENEGMDSSFGATAYKNEGAFYPMKSVCKIDTTLSQRRPFWSNHTGAPLVSPSPMDYDVYENGIYLDSWTLVDFNGSQDSSNTNTTGKSVMSILISRCMPRDQLDQNLFFIDPSTDPAAAFNFILEAPYRPIVDFDDKKKPRLSCCPVGASHNWAPVSSSTVACNQGSNLEDYVYRTFMFRTFKEDPASSNQEFAGFTELPGTGDTDDVWGLGFVMYLTDSEGQALQVYPFSVDDSCKRRWRSGETGEKCERIDMNRVKQITEGSEKTIKPNELRQYLRQNLVFSPENWTGTTKRNLHDSGIIPISK